MKIYTARATCELPEIVANLCEGNPLEKRIVFCEDKFSLTLELAIAKKTGGTFGTHVFSFNRYMHKYLAKDKKILSPEGCALVIKGLLLERKKELSCFKNFFDPNLASVVYELIAQLKSAKVTPEDIEKAMENSEGNLKRKLNDIYILFDAYEKYIDKNGLTDGNNRLYLLPKVFASSEEIKNTKIIIAGFPSLNRTLCEIFKSLTENAKDIDFVLVSGENESVYTNETYNFIIGQYPETVEIRQDREDERSQLLENLFKTSALFEEGKYSSKIKIYQAKDVKEEISHVAQTIRREVMGGANYKDFALCAEDISGYELIIRRIFADYDIPLFFDGSKDLGKHPLTRLVCSYIDLVRKNFDLSNVFAFVKNSLFEPDKEITDGFENYCLGASINRRSIKKPFTKESDNLETYEQIRLKLMKVSEFLKDCKTFESCVKGIQKMLEELGAFENILLLGEKLTRAERDEIASYNEQVKEKFEGVISDAVNLLGPLDFSLVEVKNVILSGMTACKVSVIPEYNDCVFVGDFKATRYNGVKNLFAIGLTDGVPTTKIDSALLCDSDIEKMEKSQVLVEPKIKEVNRRARETACMAIATFTDNLYLSYSESLISGEEGKPSEIIKYVVKIFSDKDKKTSVFTLRDYAEKIKYIGGEREKNFKLRNYLTERSSTFAFAEDIGNFKEGKTDEFDAAAAFYRASEKRGESEVAEGILTRANAQVDYYVDGVNYVNTGLYATAIEGHFSCPYHNFLQNGIKLVEREQSEIKANELGTMVHDVGQKFIERIDWDKVSEEEALNLAIAIFDEVVSDKKYTRYQASEGGKFAFLLIKKESVDFCMTLYNVGKNSFLKPKYVEASFGGKEPKFPAIKVNTRAGEKKISGKIDRVDVEKDGQNMIVIDYKTGKVDKSKTDLNLYTGQKLQLFLYAKALNENLTPIGTYYFPIASKFEEDESSESIMIGKTIAEKEKAKLIDGTLSDEKDKGEVINANFTKLKNGDGFRWPQGLLSKDEFDAYMEYSQLIAGEGISEISEGVIIPSPYEGACEYCKYHGICGYDEERDGRTRKVASIGTLDILKALKKQKEKEESSDEKVGGITNEGDKKED